MREDLKYTLMVTGMVVSWSVYYAVSKILVDATGSALLAGFLLESRILPLSGVFFLCGLYLGMLFMNVMPGLSYVVKGEL